MKYIIIAALSLLTVSYPSVAKDYFIKKNQHYSEGSRSGLQKVFSGQELSFRAKFNATNIYDLAGPDQVDINKLYGVSDCLSHHLQSSVRFGWRWLGDRMEIFGLIHRGGSLYFTELLGIADLNRVYDFKIKLSPDKTSYLLSFNNSQPVAIQRDCQQTNVKGYYLYPYFGGNLKAPHDMKLSIWDTSDRDFTISSIGPNPVRSQQPLKVFYNATQNQYVQFDLFDSAGAQVMRTLPQRVIGSSGQQEITIKLPPHLASGVYFLRPFSFLEQDRNSSQQNGVRGESVKVLLVN
jgi:hypothetical protein